MRKQDLLWSSSLHTHTSITVDQTDTTQHTDGVRTKVIGRDGND